MLDLSLDNDIYKTDIWDAALQELDILFNTTNTELIGQPSFGTNFDDFLWTLSPTTTALTQYIENKLMETEFVSKSRYHVNVQHKFDDTIYENMYLVTITLYDDYNSVEKTFKLNEKV